MKIPINVVDECCSDKERREGQNNEVLNSVFGCNRLSQQLLTILYRQPGRRYPPSRLADTILTIYVTAKVGWKLH